jgi:hypothetical protein
MTNPTTMSPALPPSPISSNMPMSAPYQDQRLLFAETLLPKLAKPAMMGILTAVTAATQVARLKTVAMFVVMEPKLAQSSAMMVMPAMAIAVLVFVPTQLAGTAM